MRADQIALGHVAKRIAKKARPTAAAGYWAIAAAVCHGAAAGDAADAEVMRRAVFTRHPLSFDRADPQRMARLCRPMTMMLHGATVPIGGQR